MKTAVSVPDSVFDSVANVTQMITLDREVLTDRVGRLSAARLGLVLAGIDILLGR